VFFFVTVYSRIYGDPHISRLGRAERHSAGCSWPRREWWHWPRWRQLTSYGVLPPSPLDRWCHSVKTAEDVLGFTNKCWPSHGRPLSIQLTRLTTAATDGGKFWDPR